MSGAHLEITCPLTDPAAADAARSGGKGANLAVLARAGLPVPAGFVVVTSAYRRFLHASGLAPLVAELTDGLDPADPAAVEAASTTLRQAFEAAPLPAEIEAAIATAYETCGGGPVAVRSSATAEDLPAASFAGQQETLLGVVGALEVSVAVRRCWSSLWTARALSYQARSGIAPAGLAAAVVVQRMVPAEVAGVLFTADPLSGRRDHVVVEAAAGLGEAVVGGRVTPARWVVDARTRTVVAAPAPSTGGTGDVLSPGRLQTVVDLGLRAATVFGAPQDVEWAIGDERCWLLQARPITSLVPLPSPPPAPGAGPRVYLCTNLVAQGIAEPLTPIGNAFLRALVCDYARYWTLHPHRARPRPAEPPTWLPVVLGRLYADVTPLLQAPRMRRRLVTRLGWKDPAASAALRDWLDRNAARLGSGGSVRVPLVVTRWVLRQVPGIVTAAIAPDWARRRALARVEANLSGLEQRAGWLSTAADRVDFVDTILPPRALDVVVDQLPPVWVGLLAGVAAERLVERSLGSRAGLEPVRRWLPHDPTIAMGAELHRLARSCAAAGGEPTAASPGVQRFLATYGHRAPDREIDVGVARFADDPAYVLELLRAYQVGAYEGRQGALPPDVEARGDAAAAASALVDAVRRASGPLPALVLTVLLDRFRGLGGLRERPKFDLVRAIALARRTWQQVGQALVERGVLDDPADVFFLDPADLRPALAGASGSLRELAATRRREYERELRRRQVPRVLTSEGEALYGPAAAVGAEADAGVLAGTPVSPGVHEGVVRVLDSPVGAKLRPGEVLVAASTDPGWTPLFLLAGALVMEVGGVISHGAVVAREYGIPAVAGIPDATVRLHTGQRVRVDGESGVVVLLDAAPSA